MRGHITQRTKAKGTFTIVIELGKDASGKRRQQSVTVRGSRKDAERKLAELLHLLDTGSYIQPAKTSFGEFLSRWLTDYGKPNLSPRSYEGYSQIISHYLIPQFGTITLIQLKPEHLLKFYAQELERGLSPTTIRHFHTLLHKALESALEWGLINRNVADAAQPPRTHRAEMKTWDESEVSLFLVTCKGTTYYELFYILLATGMRRSEVLGLRWSDIDLLLGQISVARGLHQLKDGSLVFTEPKSSRSRRSIALPPSATLLLKRYRDNLKLDYLMLGKVFSDDTLVFSTLGKPLRPNTVSRAWTNLAVKAGVKVIRLHDARHTHASLLLKMGVHPKIVSERLGHASIAITLDTYSHVVPGLQEAAANRFDEVLTPKV